MINHHTILREQLKRIGNLINKKYSTLRKQIIKTSQVFDNENIPIFPYEVCFGLFRQIKETGSLSSSMLFLPFLFNVINLGFSNKEMSREILTLLTQVKQIPKFQGLENQVKIQQILAALVSKNCIDLTDMKFTHSLFNVVLSLQNSKYKQLWLKSSTILHQSLLLLINDLKDNFSEQKLRSLSTFIYDLITITKQQKPKWFIQNPDAYLVFQVLCESFDEKHFENSNHYKQHFEQLVKIGREEIKKCIQNANMLNSPTKTQPALGALPKWELTPEIKLLILMRIVCKINILSKIGFEFLQQIIQIISQKRPSAIKAIAYESLNYLFRHSSWMYHLFQSEYTDLFNFLLTTQFNNVKYLLENQKDKIDLTIYLNGQDTNFNKILGSNSIEINAIQFTYSHQIKMIVKNLEQVTSALYSIYTQKFKIDMNEKIEGKPPLEKTYKFCQKTVFQTIKAILPKQMSEDTLQSLLKISQKFINLSGCFSDSNVSSIYIKLMCKYCLPSQFKNIGHRHIQINKMILNTANCLGHLFTSSCWVIVWKALENYSMYYNRYLMGKQQLQAARESDVQILYKSMDSIFSESEKYGDGYLLQIIRSLVEVAYECLENNYNDETRKIFAFQRIQQIYRLNLHRVCLIWPQLSSSLLIITTSKVLYFRLSALGLLKTLIPMTLNYLKNHPQALKNQFTPQNYQQKVLEPWINLVSCQFQQIKQQLILAVNKLIIDYGHIMQNGWKCIMQIVKKTNDLKSLQAIVQTFLQKVHDYTMDVIVCVDAIQRKLQDTNQKYLCLTMIWSVADYARKNQQLEVLKKIYQILLVPQQMFNLGTQARHSSFYIFAEIVVHNCGEKKPEFWEWIFSEIKKFYTYGIQECINAKDKTFAEEAIKNLICNLVKIYKKFFKVAKQWQQKSDLLSTLLGDFYSFCSLVLQFRSSQTYQVLIKQVKQILYFKIQQSVNLKQFSIFIESLTQIYFVENQSKILKCLITYLPNDIYDLLSNSVEGLTKNFLVIYKLVQKVFLLRLEVQQKEIKLQQMRIFFEEKHHYEYMKKMQTFLQQKQPTLIPLYIENICKTIQKLKLYQDYHSLQKTLPFLTSTHIKFQNALPTRVLDTMKQIINIRYEQNWIRSASNGKDIPIWYVCSQDLMKISYDFLQIQHEEVKSAYNVLKQLLINSNLGLIQSYSHDSSCHFFQKEIEICHFLFLNYYLADRQPVCESEKQDVQQITKILLKRSQFLKIQDSSKKAHNAYLLLFKIASERQQYKHKKIQQNQATIVGLLFERILQTFDKIKVGKNEVNDLQQLKFVLKQMQNMKLKPKILQTLEKSLSRVYLTPINFSSPVLQLNSAHLFFFQPLLAKCIRCEDQQNLQLIQNIVEQNTQIVLNL